MGDIAALVVKRTFSAVVVIFVVVSGMFGLLRMAGDPALIVAGDDATEAEVQFVREQLGFDRPVIVQYLSFLGGVVQGDFGESIRYRAPALGVVMERFPATAILAISALLLAVLISIPIGILAALKPGSMIDSVSRIIAVAGQSMPIFWLGILLILFFAVNLGWLPAGGSGSFQHLILPTITLGAYSVPITMRLVRSSMIEVLGKDFIMAARAKGVGGWSLIIGHAFRNASIPVLTIIALRLGAVIAGTVVLEEVFGYPGMGRLAIQSMVQFDFTVIQAFVFVIAVLIVSINLLVDIAYGLTDPRIRVK